MRDSQHAKSLLKNAAANFLHYSGLLKLIPNANQQSWRILMYHRIIDPGSVPYPLQPGMYVTPENFAMQMHYLAKEARVIGIDQLTEELARGDEIPAKTVVITFDDGWADNYEHAFPILKELQLPASIYLATSFIGTNKSYWTDSIAQALQALSEGEKFRATVCARLRESESIPEEASSQCCTIIESNEKEFLSDEYDELVEYLKTLDYEERMRTVNSILTLAKEFTSSPQQRSFLTWEEVAKMAQHGITFGSHTHHHQPLIELSDARVKDELANSLLEFKEHNVSPTSVFCYPRGAYSQATQAALKEKDISYALTVERESELDASPALLGRIGIHDDVSNTLALFCSRIWFTKAF